MGKPIQGYLRTKAFCLAFSGPPRCCSGLWKRANGRKRPEKVEVLGSDRHSLLESSFVASHLEIVDLDSPLKIMMENSVGWVLMARF